MTPEIKTVRLSEVLFDESIYPRKTHNPGKVQQYADQMEAIEAEQNFMHVSANLKLLDGRHRQLAYLTISDGADRDVTVYMHDITEAEHEYRKAIELNNSHGQQLSHEDKRQNCAHLYSKYGYTLDNIATLVAVSKTFAANATKAIREKEEEDRNNTIFDMWMACYTQDEIAEKVDVTQPTVINKIKSFINKVPKYFSDKTLDFDRDSDFKPPLYNVWSFAKKTNDVSHFGNSEQRIVDNLLYLYTEPFDIVLDPFAGGGSTIDVCRRRLRRCYASDRKPIPARENEIRKLDIAAELPPLNRNWSEVSLTYLDPPYWKQAEGQYSKDAEDLANMPLEQFTSTLAGIVKKIAAKQSKGVIALLIQPTQWKAENRETVDHVFDLIGAVGNKKLTVEARVSCPYATEQYNAQQLEWAKEHKKLLVLTRELIIWRVNQ